MALDLGLCSFFNRRWNKLGVLFAGDEQTQGQGTHFYGAWETTTVKSV